MTLKAESCPTLDIETDPGPSLKNFDALVIGFYEGDRLVYAARTRSGFTPASRAELFKKIKPLEIKECPFADLPETPLPAEPI